MTTLTIQTNTTTGFSAYVDSTTGEAFFTQTAILNITGISNHSFEGLTRKLGFEGVGNSASKTTEILTEGGLQRVANLYSVEQFWDIIQAYRPTSVSKQALKQQLIDTIVKAGLTAYAYNLCGYQMTKVEEVKMLPKLAGFELVQAITETTKDIYALPDGYLKELIRDMLVAELSQKQLAATKPEYTTVKVRAKELGFSVAQIGTGSQLGKWVKSHIDPAFVERVGKYEVKHYEVNGRLDDVIDGYFR